MAWLKTLNADEIEAEDVVNFTWENHHYALYKSAEGDVFATDGYCTHEDALLCEGFVYGEIIECPKHNGKFNYKTGEAKALPCLVALKTYETKVDDGVIYIFVNP